MLLVPSPHQHIQALPPVSGMERGSSEPPVARNTDAAPSTSTVPVPRSSSFSCRPQPGSKKHKRTPLYQRSVRGHVRAARPDFVVANSMACSGVQSDKRVLLLFTGRLAEER